MFSNHFVANAFTECISENFF